MIVSLAVVMGWFIVAAVCRPWVFSREQWLVVDVIYCVVCLSAGIAFYGSEIWQAGPVLLSLSALTRSLVVVVSGLMVVVLPGVFLLVRRYRKTLRFQFEHLVLIRPAIVWLCLLMVVAFAEEFVFRAVLIQALVADGLGSFQGTVMSWVLFCIAHLGWNKISGLGDVAVAGAVICLSFLVAGLVGSLMVHCLYNISTAVFRLSEGEDHADEGTSSVSC